MSFLIKEYKATMKKLILSIGLILSASTAWSAAMTTTRAGDWSNITPGVTPWTALTGSGTDGLPGTSDTVTLSHAVTVSSTEVMGTSPATSVAVITINNNGTSTNGSLTIQQLGDLSVRGQITTSGSAGATSYIRIEAGGHLRIDSTQATAQVRYQIRLGGISDYIILAGTSTHGRARLTNIIGNMPNAGDVTSLGAQINGPSFAGVVKNLIVGTYGDITGFGGTGTSYASYGATFPDLADCVISTCGTFYSAGTFYGDSVISYQRCKFINSVESNIIIRTGNVLNTTGTRQIVNSVFDRGIGWSASDITAQNNIVSGYPASSGVVQTTGLGLISDSLLILPFANSGSEVNNRYDNVYILGIGNATNARFAATGSTYGDPDSSTPLFNNLIFDYPDTSSVDLGGWTGSDWGDHGDLIQTPSSNPASPITSSLWNSIALKTYAGNAADGYLSRGYGPGAAFTGRGYANTIMKMRDCTWYNNDGSATLGSHGGINVAEAASSPVGVVPEFYNNILYSTRTAGVPALKAPATLTNPFTPSGVHHNASWNMITHNQPTSSSDDTIYYGETTGTIGTGDLISVNPQFVDDERCFVKWVRVLRGDMGTGAWSAGKRADETYTDAETIIFGLAEMRKVLDEDFDSRYTQAALKEYVREGFRPTNPAYNQTGSAGDTIGAVEYTSGGGGNFGSGTISGKGYFPIRKRFNLGNK